MSADGNRTAARSEQGGWLGYAQIALIVVALAAALYFARAPSFGDPLPEAATAASEAPPVVDVVQPQPTAQALTVELTGTVDVRDRVTIMSEVAGRVAWLAPEFTEGGFMAADETLVRIDPAGFELAVAEAEAGVAGAQARVWLEEALGESSVRTFARANPEAEPSALVQRLPHIALAQAELQQAEVQLQQAELQLARTAIALPYAVRVVATDAAVGEWVDPDGDPRLGLVYEPGTSRISVPIEPDRLAYLAPALGRRVRIAGQAGAWDGEVVGVSSVVNPQSRLGMVFIEFTADEDASRLPAPGTFVEIAIEGPALAEAYALPAAVAQANGVVWVVREGRLQALRPEVYGWADDRWVVQAFDAGEGVVVGTLPGAREGLEVVPQPVPESQ